MNDETEQSQTQQPVIPPADGAPEGLQQPDAQLTPDEIVAIGSEAVSTMLATDTAGLAASSNQKTPEVADDDIETKGAEHISTAKALLTESLVSFLTLPPKTYESNHANDVVLNLGLKAVGVLCFGLLAKFNLDGTANAIIDAATAGSGFGALAAATFQTMAHRA